VLAVPKNSSENKPISPTDWVDLLACVIATGRRLQREIERGSRRQGLSDSQFLLLWLCSQGPQQGSAQSEMAARLGLSAAQVSGLVEQLRGEELLTCQRSPSDRRRQLWRPTDSGKQVLQRISSEWNFAQITESQLAESQITETESLSTESLRALHSGLERIGKLATAAADGPPSLRMVGEAGGIE
jgi:DNA-binding MarR family transcriptional regulator